MKPAPRSFLLASFSSKLTVFSRFTCAVKTYTSERQEEVRVMAVQTEQWGAMNAIMLLQVFLQVLKKQWAMRLECLVLIIACLSAGFSRWVNTHDYAVNDLKRMFAVCLVCVRKKIVCHKCRGMLSNLKSNRENYAVCSLLLKLKDSYLTSFPSHYCVFYTDIFFINTNLFCQTRTCLPVTGRTPF